MTIKDIIRESMGLLSITECNKLLIEKLKPYRYAPATIASGKFDDEIVAATTSAACNAYRHPLTKEIVDRMEDQLKASKIVLTAEDGISFSAKAQPIAISSHEDSVLIHYQEGAKAITKGELIRLIEDNKKSQEQRKWDSIKEKHGL